MDAFEGRSLDPLPRDECVRLMEDHPARVGRIALAGPRPVVFPVNYVIDGDLIIFRSDPGTKLHAAVHKSFVAFEVDWVEPDWKVGWSVVVRGQAHVVDDPAEIERLSALPLQTWAAGRKDNFIAVKMDLVSGRRLG